MVTQTLSHMRGGKVFGYTMILLVAAWIVIVALLFSDKMLTRQDAIYCIVVTGLAIWLVVEIYKPSFAKLIFSDACILSKVGFHMRYIDLKDVKGIWVVKYPYKNAEIEKYTPESRPPKRSLIVFGDLECYDGAGYIGIWGVKNSYMLIEPFSQGYTTIYYRKALDNILAYYDGRLGGRNINE